MDTLSIGTTFADVVTEINALLAVGIVATGLAVIIGIRLLPKIVRAVRSVVSRG